MVPRKFKKKCRSTKSDSLRRRRDSVSQFNEDAGSSPVSRVIFIIKFSQADRRKFTLLKKRDVCSNANIYQMSFLN